jgi:hypothetical protein
VEPVPAFTDLELFDLSSVVVMVEPVLVFGVLWIKKTIKIAAIKNIIKNIIKHPLVLFIYKHSFGYKIINNKKQKNDIRLYFKKLKHNL